MTTFKTVGVLCPINLIDAANTAAFTLSGVEADLSTFTEAAVLTRDGELFCYAHGPMSVGAIAQLPALAEQLGGIFFLTNGDFWVQVAALGFEVVGE